MFKSTWHSTKQATNLWPREVLNHNFAGHSQFNNEVNMNVNHCDFLVPHLGNLITILPKPLMALMKADMKQASRCTPVFVLQEPKISTSWSHNNHNHWILWNCENCETSTYFVCEIIHQTHQPPLNFHQIPPVRHQGPSAAPPLMHWAPQSQTT